MQERARLVRDCRSDEMQTRDFCTRPPRGFSWERVRAMSQADALLQGGWLEGSGDSLGSQLAQMPGTNRRQIEERTSVDDVGILGLNWFRASSDDDRYYEKLEEKRENQLPPVTAWQLCLDN